MHNSKLATWVGLLVAVAAAGVTFAQTHQMGGPTVGLIAAIVAALGKGLGAPS